jgi:hypothetical protein
MLQGFQICQHVRMTQVWLFCLGTFQLQVWPWTCRLLWGLQSVFLPPPKKNSPLHFFCQWKMQEKYAYFIEAYKVSMISSWFCVNMLQSYQCLYKWCLNVLTRKGVTPIEGVCTLDPEGGHSHRRGVHIGVHEHFRKPLSAGWGQLNPHPFLWARSLFPPLTFTGMVNSGNCLG